MIEISPSILAADFGNLKEEIKLVEAAGADSIHLDVMDGHFVPNISYGPPVIKSIRKLTTLPLQAHLMIENPGRYLEDYAACGVEGITIHLEIAEDAGQLATAIRKLGIAPGLAINPDTEIDSNLETLRLFDRLLFMTVYPGFGGQSFLPAPLKKIEKIASLPGIPLIEVDGGINIDTAPLAIAAGAGSLVAGSAIFRSADPAASIKSLRNA